jgi:hypothetical protein
MGSGQAILKVCSRHLRGSRLCGGTGDRVVFFFLFLFPLQLALDLRVDQNSGMHFESDIHGDRI